MTFEYRDNITCDKLVAQPDTDDNRKPVVFISTTGLNNGVYVPVDHVEELVAGIRDTARTASGQQPEHTCPDGEPCPGHDQLAEETPDRLVHVGWWCWRGDNYGHLTTQACRSDNVPIHVPADWATSMEDVIQRLEDGDEDHAAPAVGQPEAHTTDRATALREAAEVSARAARACGDSEAGQYAASVAAGIGKELRRMAEEDRS